MKAEIIAVGTELLLGQIVNTNAQYLSRKLAGIGIDVYFQTVVGDNMNRLMDAFRLAGSRADFVIATGGLGPTQDDITKDALAKLTGEQLVYDEPSLARIESYFRERGVDMVESNARQALILTNSEALPNDTGLAAGVAATYSGVHYILLPGPPRELTAMVDTYTLPWLKAKIPSERTLYSKMLKFGGIGESALEHRLLDLIEAQRDVTIAPYASEGEVTVRLSVKGASHEEADRKMSAVEREIRQRLANYLFSDQDESLEAAVVRTMLERKTTLSVAESCTGGMLAELITSVPGCSQMFRGGTIVYSNDLKHRLLQVPMELLEGEGAPGAVSEQAARLMAERMRELSGSDYAVAITGVAGPAESEGKPAGLVYVAVSSRDRTTSCETMHVRGSREVIRLRAAKQALYMLWKLNSLG